MAVRHQLIRRSPEELWAVLADRSRYQDWVVGTARSRPKDGNWPEVGATLEYTVRLGPWEAVGHTVVRHSDPPRTLELEVDSGRLGTARIALEVRPWGADSLVIVDEHPLAGPGGRLHNGALDVLLQLRHRSMLSRLAAVVEEAPARAPTGT
ncbi:SRPBCC family protein [Streptomyces lydicamycinicus]|uniref:SRPBCC family protein n=1 Tax=Streptomyces lydicamycinicus TaxID=1546107 RepID=UPI0005AAD7B9|nr:SRPBCC family protein [Streptomyces lydicamycinicus]USA04225.1 SRPBCC family protein [Streptomyces lydicamycinicus]